MAIVLTSHARRQARRRGIDEMTVRSVAESPEQVLARPGGREVRQSRVRFAEGEYLVRLVMERSAGVDLVITVYRTSKLDKYWENR